ncbi:MAG: hypothetical protein ACRDHF_09995, partial [Tepidiformaceae bacterium]
LMLLVANTVVIVALAGGGLLVLLMSTASGGTGAPVVTPGETSAATTQPTRYVPVPAGRSMPPWDPENGWLSEFAALALEQTQYAGR